MGQLMAAIDDASIRHAGLYTGDFRPEGCDDHDIYDWFINGHGSGEMDTASAAWKNVGVKLQEASDLIKNGLDAANVAWQGQAKDKFQEANTPLISYTAEFAAKAKSYSEVLQAQSGSYKKARALMQPALPAIAEDLNAISPFGFIIDDFTSLGAKNGNKQVLATYGQETGDNLTKLFANKLQVQTPPDVQVTLATPPANRTKSAISAPHSAYVGGTHRVAPHSNNVGPQTHQVPAQQPPAAGGQSPTHVPPTPPTTSPVTHAASSVAPVTPQAVAPVVTPTSQPVVQVPAASATGTPAVGGFSAMPFGPSGLRSGGIKADYARFNGSPLAAGTQTNAESRLSSAPGTASAEAETVAAREVVANAAAPSGANAQAAGLYPPGGMGMARGYAQHEDGGEYKSKYLVEVDSLFGDHRMVVPTVLGEDM